MHNLESGLDRERESASELCTQSKESLISEDDDSINLLDMPLEIFLKICSYLDADFISTLRSVCVRFAEILADGSLWRSWVSRRVRNAYPALRHLSTWRHEEPNWEEACIDMDRETRRWRNVATSMLHTVVRDVHYATVDSVLLMNSGELCASGGRDRGLALWKVSDIRDRSATESDAPVKPTKMVLDAHRGWVWDLAADHVAAPATLYSGSWDNTIKVWDLETNLECKGTFECKMSVLAVVGMGEVVLGGLYSRQVVTFDTRAGPRSVSTYKLHRGPVLKLQAHGHLIASLSEDRTLAVWDRRAGKALASDIKCTGENAFPVCLSWSAAALYVGDSKGSLHLVDPESFVPHRSYELWEEPRTAVACDKVTGIHQGLGSLLVASDKGDIKCLYPSDPTQEYASIRAKAKDIVRLQYQSDVLVLGTCESSLEFWTPAPEP